LHFRVQFDLALFNQAHDRGRGHRFGHRGQAIAGIGPRWHPVFQVGEAVPPGPGDAVLGITDRQSGNPARGHFTADEGIEVGWRLAQDRGGWHRVHHGDEQEEQALVAHGCDGNLSGVINLMQGKTPAARKSA
jgi:hypothetical protein